MGQFQAGHGRECITPPLGIRMVGYASRKEGATGVHDELFVNAVVLKSEDQTVALLTFDICLLTLDGAARCKAAIEQELGLGPEHVFLNTSHTHAGPRLSDRDGANDMERAYTETVLAKTLTALRAALADTAPATFHVGAAPLDIGCNRREMMDDGKITLGHNPEGLTRHELSVWKFARDGKPDVVVFSSPMHGTTMGQKNLILSAEWMGMAVQYVEEDTPDVRCAFLQGCGADQDPYYSMDGVRGTFEEVEQHGRKAADAVGQAMADLRELAPLPLRLVLTTAELPGKEDAAQTQALPIHGMRLGDAVLVALGCEAFVEFDLFARRESQAAETLTLGYTDGNIGYLCTADVFETGGYETNTTRVAPESEGLAKEAIAEVLQQLTGD